MFEGKNEEDGAATQEDVEKSVEADEEEEGLALPSTLSVAHGFQFNAEAERVLLAEVLSSPPYETERGAVPSRL
ncbi:hypothetical protein GN244_ATG06322 [Phytophthora infestans]|uniref:Uncharacterized protein n=1 Tax=Phytophthora infestans TaxID=4787 RepID=A0A833WXM1_PHYIN|nr:hypothetical protein GN244_ATG06322 [Phytophthora infestans]